MSVRKVNRGSRMLTAEEQNRYADAANLALRQELAEPVEEIIRRNDTNLARVRNDTAFNLRAGDVMELDQMLIQGATRRREMLWSIRFPETTYYDGTFVYDPLGGRCGVVLEDIPAGETGFLQMAGIAIARVLLRSASHRHACFSAGTTAGGGQKGRWMYSGEQGEALLLPVGYALGPYEGQSILMPVQITPLQYRRPVVRARLLVPLAGTSVAAQAVVERPTLSLSGADFFGALNPRQFGGGYVQPFPTIGMEDHVITVYNFGSGRNWTAPYKFTAAAGDYVLATWTGVANNYIILYVYDQVGVTTTAPPPTTTTTTRAPTTSADPTTTPTPTTTVAPTTAPPTTAPPTTTPPTTAPPTTTAPPGCGTCTYSWTDMTSEWTLTSDNCTGICNCAPPASPGSFDGQIVITDCA